MDYSNVKINKKFFDPTFPLLDRFRELAPGSYKHCQNVSNMCETIASELGLNIELVKCCALFHDCGKMNNPLYFSENQSEGINVHDTLDPYMSYNMITKHVGDGVIHLLQIEDMPHEVIEIISQHHGDTIVQAFYVDGEPEDKFRYKCARPESTEALILMIVDSVEATAKALFNNNDKGDTKKIISKAINGTVERLANDRQLDNMKIGTLNITKKFLTKELESIYHKRVLYDNADDEKTIGELKEETEPSSTDTQQSTLAAV
jgi:hypothetical protein